MTKKQKKHLKSLERRLESVEANLGVHFIQDHGYIDTGTEFVRPLQIPSASYTPRATGLAAVNAQRESEQTYTEYSEPEGA